MTNHLQQKVTRLEGLYNTLKAETSAIGERATAAGRMMTVREHATVRRKMEELQALSLRLQEARAIAATFGARPF